VPEAVWGRAAGPQSISMHRGVRTNSTQGASMSANAEPPKPAKKPRLPALDSIRFFLISYIAVGHFIAFGTKDLFLQKLFSQVNVVVGAFFVLSGYVAGYTATELNLYKHSPRIDNAVAYTVGRIGTFYPLYMLTQLLFAPMFVWVDNMFNGPVLTAMHALMTGTLTQAWFPAHAELWNAPAWFLSALAFAMIPLPYALPGVAKMTKKGLRKTLVALTAVCGLAKLAYSYDLAAWGLMEGMMAPKAHPNILLWNATRFSPLLAFCEVLMGAVAARLVMTDNTEVAEDKGPAAPASPLLPLVAMGTLIYARAAGWVTMNDPIARTFFFIPLCIMFFVRIHRETVDPKAAGWNLSKVMSWGPLTYLGTISFPIFMLHGPLGQVFYKRAVAKALWGGVLSQTVGYHFFWAYLAITVALAAVVQKVFLENKAVGEATGRAVKALSAALS